MRQVSEYSRPIVNGVYHGAQIISYLRQKIWDMLSEKLENIDIIKKEIKTRKLDN